VENIRTALASYQKDGLRYRTSKNLYCRSIEFRCYFSAPEEIGRFSQNHLAGYNLVRSPCLGKEEQKTPYMLHQEAYNAVGQGFINPAFQLDL